MADTSIPAFLSPQGAVNPTGGDTKQGPEQNPEFVQGGAPGGKWPTDGSPRSISGGMPMTTGGFRPSPENPPLPEPGTSNGGGKMPGAR